MDVKEHIHPCDRANFWRWFEFHGGFRYYWVALTFNGVRP